ncbi:peroxiredoxin [Stereum hirsutum FP-91666 SS1]|uniref:peroxiredoxin n=1 Tax=Stereum hirsutum (strain FP-91666) TaxID=721885 RepID=UPI0004449697|nr:peroxiredoxin [Stereum hirsutum FP-91666 SS1]EIM80687.1 peroxiredoxin [Stereum hirsutum FP-91666 SS1]
MSTARIQHPAPGFTAPAVVEGLFKDISLSEYLGQWVILFFWPMDFTFVCPTEILAFNDALPAFKSVNTALLGVSTDSEYTHFAWASQDRKEGGIGPNLELPLIADKNHKISRDYGVLLEDKGVALRGSFLIDPKGILRQITVNDLPVGRSVDEALRLVKAFQFTEQYGEVCPANWTEGSRTIKATPTDKLEYFSAVGQDAAKQH